MNVDTQTGVLVLQRGDALADLPETHVGMLSEPARALFADPSAYFARLAAACPFPQMARWLAAVADDDRGELHLIPFYRGMKSGSSGYLAQPAGMHAVLYYPPLGAGEYDISAAPTDLQTYYRLANTLR